MGVFEGCVADRMGVLEGWVGHRMGVFEGCVADRMGVFDGWIGRRQDGCL